MSSFRLRRQVEAILDGNGIRWVEQGDVIVTRFSSALVHLSFSAWGTQNLIHVHSEVLSNLDPEVFRVAIEVVNELNRQSVFGRWVLHGGGSITLESDLLGDFLQEEELMTTLTTMARLADHHDDRLQSVLGGERAVDLGRSPM